MKINCAVMNIIMSVLEYIASTHYCYMKIVTAVYFHYCKYCTSVLKPSLVTWSSGLRFVPIWMDHMLCEILFLTMWKYTEPCYYCPGSFVSRAHLL